MDKAKFQYAYDLYRQRPTLENAKVLLTFTGDWMRTKEPACLGPCLAILEVLNERDQFLKNFAGKMIQRFLPWWARRYMPEHRPAWNDYHMTRWQLTKDATHIEQIHRVASHVKQEAPWDMAVFTAKWMADSVRAQDEEFDAAMKAAETRCLLCKCSPSYQIPTVTAGGLQ
jgi:hypothetical protein